MSAPSDDINALIDEFAFLEDWEQRYRHVIELGQELDPLPVDAKTDDTRVRGCVSQVWLTVEPLKAEPPRLTFKADSDAHIVRGLAAILLRIYSGHTPREILDVDAERVFRTLGLDEHLSPQRSNGLRAMVERIRSIAEEHQSSLA